MKIIPRNTPQACYYHYCRQAGLGGRNYNNDVIFRGGSYQKGSGLLSTFGKVAVPLITPLLKKAAMSAGRYLLNKGGQFLSDVTSGTPAGAAARQRLKQMKSDVINTIARRQSGTGRRKRKRPTLSAPFPYIASHKTARRKRKRSSVKRSLSKKRKTHGKKKRTKRKKTDIFD